MNSDPSMGLVYAAGGIPKQQWFSKWHWAISFRGFSNLQKKEKYSQFTAPNIESVE